MKRTIYKSSNLTSIGTNVTRHFYRDPVAYPDGVMVEQRIEQAMDAGAVVTSIFIPEDAWQDMIRSRSVTLFDKRNGACNLSACVTCQPDIEGRV